MTADIAVSVEGLVKTYGRPDGLGTFNAVDGLSFEVRAGEVFGILGPNGAGKTTTLEIVEGLTTATAGRVTVLGLDVARFPDRVKRRIGIQLQASSYFEHLRLAEILVLFGRFYGRRVDADRLLEIVDLGDKRDALVRHLSGGQAQRFSIVAALVNDPEVLFLDEPTTGLDPQARRHLWEVVEHLNREAGVTIVLTTHYMEEAEALAHRIGIVDSGRLVALDTPAGLISGLAAAHRMGFSAREPLDPAALSVLPGVAGVDVHQNGTFTYRLTVDDPTRAVPAVYDWAGRHSIDLLDVNVGSPTLEDVFLATTGRQLRD